MVQEHVRHSNKMLTSSLVQTFGANGGQPPRSIARHFLVSRRLSSPTHGAGPAVLGKGCRRAPRTRPTIGIDGSRECRSVEALAPVPNAAGDREHRADMKIKQPT